MVVGRLVSGRGGVKTISGEIDESIEIWLANRGFWTEGCAGCRGVMRGDGG